MDSRHVRIALLARRFRLLADRPEYMRREPAERVEATMREHRQIPLSLLDQTQVQGSGEIDWLCAAMVKRCRSASRRGIVGLLDVLGYLDPDRICAIYHALPEVRRAWLLADATWAYFIQQVEDDMPDALAEVEELARVGDEHARTRADIVADMSGEDAAYWTSVERTIGRAVAGCGG